MKIARRSLLKTSGMAAAGAVASQLNVPALLAEETQIFERDVCVIGGGSAGTYTSVRLGDLGKSVMLLERSDRLGGHAETYIDPATGTPIDIGVVDFEATQLVLNYFNRFNVDYVASGDASAPNANLDFTTGLPLSNYTPPSDAALAAALGTYYEILATKYPYLDAGFELPNPVPAELLEPFSTFVTTYGLQALVPTLFEYSQGAGNLLSDPTLYILKLFGLSVVEALFGAGFLNLPKGTVQLYDAAKTYLGGNVLLNARICSVDRSRTPIEVQAETPNGRVVIKCGKLVWAAPPTLWNLAPVNLDQTETAVFGQLRAKCYTTGIVRLSGLPTGLSLTNLGQNTLYNLPQLPGLYGIQATVPGLYLAFFGSENPLPSEEVELLIAQQVEGIARAGTYPVRFEGFKIFSNHTPFQLGVAASEIAGGFYTRMNALQGRHNTFYNGAAWQTNDSSLIWQSTENLLPKIIG